MLRRTGVPTTMHILHRCLITLSALSLAVCGASATAQTYMETVTAPTTIRSGQTHDDPVTYDVSTFNYPYGSNATPGSSTVTFVSTPAPSVLARSRAEDASSVAAGELDYDFYYSGPKLSFVPIRFSGLFSLRSGASAYVGLNLDTSTPDQLTPSGWAGFQLGCAQSCSWHIRPLARADGRSGIDVPYVTGASIPGSVLSSATGSFSGIVWAATDQNGRGIGHVELRASASAVGNRLSTAFIDPVLSIDADFLAANPTATLSLPTGVGNAAPVPEPAAALLLLGGPAAVGVASRRGGQAQG